MSVHYVYKKDGGAKFMRPILTREEYLALRNGGEQTSLLSRIRQGEVKLKYELVEMNYSCLPNEDGSLKGSKTMSNTVGMDITKDQYFLMRQSQGKSGDGESTIRVWINRGHIIYDEVSGRYCKTEEYKGKYGSKI